MPQMAPSFWIYLMILTLTILCMIMIKIFFMFYPSLTMSKTLKPQKMLYKIWNI